MENKEDYMYRKLIGKKIKIARNRAGYTQEQLAEKLSLSTRYISQLERGISFGTVSTIVNICKALNVSANYLFSDLIDSNECSEIVDINFMKNYAKLNPKNKEIINAFTNLKKIYLFYIQFKVIII